MFRNLIVGVILAGFATAAFAADPHAGEHIFKSQCGICHSAAKGRNVIGPSLFGVVGRKAGTEPGYHYSAANEKSGITWTAAELENYLKNPQKVVPGTKMTYAGLKDDTKRADVIAFLDTLH